MSEATNTMTYKIFRNNQWEEVTPEAWRWVAIYQDGKVLKQFDDHGTFHQFAEINQAELATFKMVNDDHPDFTLLFNPEKMKLIHFYKRVRLNICTEDEVNITAYCVGWETKIFNHTVKTIGVILPTGEIVLTENADLIEFK